VQCPAGEGTSGFARGVQARADECKKCRLGRYSPEHNNVCTSATCKPGSSSTDTARGQCTVCARGSFSSGAEAQCQVQACNVGSGTTNVTGGATEPSDGCEACKPGAFSAGGSSQCKICPAGEFSAGGVGHCAICPLATFSHDGSSSCQDQQCPSGTAVAAVEGGAKSIAQGCVGCTPGSFSPGGLSPCKMCRCAKGAGVVAENATSCTCEVCPNGSFSGNDNHSACLPSDCPAGQSASRVLTGATSSTDGCTRCPVAHFSPGGSITECPPMNCPVGTIVSPVSNYSANNATAGCRKCPKHTFSAGAQTLECSPCTTPADGTTTLGGWLHGSDECNKAAQPIRTPRATIAVGSFGVGLLCCCGVLLWRRRKAHAAASSAKSSNSGGRISLRDSLLASPVEDWSDSGSDADEYMDEYRQVDLRFGDNCALAGRASTLQNRSENTGRASWTDLFIHSAASQSKGGQQHIV
jgi:hypothetical protein